MACSPKPRAGDSLIVTLAAMAIVQRNGATQLQLIVQYSGAVGSYFAGARES